MESTTELNKELKEEVNKIFADLFKEIGSNRAQLSNKVLVLHKEFNKELSKEKVDGKRKAEILSEISRIVKMAAQQLPHLKRIISPKPAMASPKPSVAVAKPADTTPKPEAPKSIPAAKKKSAPAAKTPVKKKKK
jgi:hypothetical protein